MYTSNTKHCKVKAFTRHHSSQNNMPTLSSNKDDNHTCNVLSLITSVKVTCISSLSISRYLIKVTVAGMWKVAGKKRNQKQHHHVPGLFFFFSALLASNPLVRMFSPWAHSTSPPKKNKLPAVVNLTIIWKIVSSCVGRTKNCVNYLLSDDGYMDNFLWYILEKLTFPLGIKPLSWKWGLHIANTFMCNLTLVFWS